MVNKLQNRFEVVTHVIYSPSLIYLLIFSQEFVNKFILVANSLANLSTFQYQIEITAFRQAMIYFKE